MDQKKVALRKRTQIAMANKVMFLWVAGASIIFGFALVISIFLFQMLTYNEKVIAAKDETIYNLKADLENIGELESKIRALDANELLLALKAQPDDNAIQVILDALPSDVNSSALGASIQDKLLSGIDGLRITSLQVDPVPGIESTTNNNAVYDASTASSVSEYVITFHFEVTGNEAALKKALTNLEASIRTIDIMTLKIEGTNTEESKMTVNARAFYEPERVLELKEKAIAQ